MDAHRKDTRFVLASVATGWLWLMATVAFTTHTYAMARWIPLRKFWKPYPFIMAGCGVGMIFFGQWRGFSLAAMVTGYAFALIGLTIGMFPTRKRFTVWAHEIEQGVRREKYDYPASHLAFCGVTVVAVLVLAFALTQ
ncbi:hypothetical protein [Streptomyces sp. NPDC007264]|uniref:hypothetical protein n=1 Tax=Streptomyces sp. NPDC007264 TaxID=3364777 RepID=UPI0036DD9444